MLICKYHFGNTRVYLFIKWIGTHAEYTKICSEGKQFEKIATIVVKG